jgi:hypothetical protein
MDAFQGGWENDGDDESVPSLGGNGDDESLRPRPSSIAIASCATAVPTHYVCATEMSDMSSIRICC